MGFNAQQSSIADCYSNSGSCYITSTGFLVLGLSYSHEFWTKKSDSMFTQEACWSEKQEFKKYMIKDLSSFKYNTVFILYGEKLNYGLNLTKYLNEYFIPAETVYVEDSLDLEEHINKITHKLTANKIVVSYSTNFCISVKLKNLQIKNLVGDGENHQQFFEWCFS
jgi:hypothetical protein